MDNGLQEYKKNGFHKYNADNLSKGVYTIPKGAKTLEGFADNQEIKKVIFPESWSIIPAKSFWCAGLTQLTLTASINTIEAHAFCECLELSAIDFVDGLVTIGSYAFEKTAIKSLALPNSLRTVGQGAFLGCTELQGLTLNEGLQTILADAFNGMSATTVNIPASVESIGYQAFADSELVTVFINSSKIEIDSEAFSNCEDLTHFVVLDKYVQQFKEMLPNIQEFIISKSKYEKLIAKTSNTQAEHEPLPSSNLANISSKEKLSP